MYYLKDQQAMPTSEKFFLKWNDFQENVSTAFSSLRKDNEFTDVTLACEDGRSIEAHKVILAASSPFFQNLLKRNKHVHPLIYMRGLKSDDLIAIVDFLYYGEANIYQENLDAFLTIAEELNLKGLNGEGKAAGEHLGKPLDETSSQNPTPQIIQNQTILPPESLFVSDFNFGDKLLTERTIALPKHEFSGDIQELDEKIETMMTLGTNMIPDGPNKKQRATICQVCGKEGKRWNIRRHIELHHIDGISIPCNFCENTFRAKIYLTEHLRNNHK